MQMNALIRKRKSQAFIGAVIVLVIVLSLGTALLFHSRSLRDVTRLQVNTDQAYSLAKSGMAIAQRYLDDHPTNPALNATTYNLGQGNVTVEITFDSVTKTGNITSKGRIGTSTRTLTKAFSFAVSSCETSWAKAYGGAGIDRLYLVAQTADQGYILGGQTEQLNKGGGFGAGKLDLMLIKTNSSGVKEWAYAYGGTEGEGPYWNTIRIANAGYILAAFSTSIGGSDTIMVKVTDNGSLEWARGFVGSGVDIPYAVIQTKDGGYLLAIATTSFTVNGQAILLIKTNSLGVTSWANIYDSVLPPSGGIDDVPNDILEDAANNRYVVVGYRYASTNFDAVIFGVNRGDGAIVFQKRYGDGGNEGFSSISLAAGGYILGGYTNSFGPVNSQDNFLLMKTDALGSKSWAKAYDVAQYNQDMLDLKRLADGYLLGGWCSIPLGDEFLAVKTDLNGVGLWSKICGDAGSGNEYINSLDQSGSCGYILGGATNTYGTNPGTYNFLVTKVGSTGELSDCTPNICRNAENFSATDANILEVPGFSYQAPRAPTGLSNPDIGPSGTNNIVRNPADGVITTPVCQ